MELKSVIKLRLSVLCQSATLVGRSSTMTVELAAEREAHNATTLRPRSFLMVDRGRISLLANRDGCFSRRSREAPCLRDARHELNKLVAALATWPKLNLMRNRIVPYWLCKLAVVAIIMGAANAKAANTNSHDRFCD